MAYGEQEVLHWYDFLCPFCYIGQHRTAILEKGGLNVTELPFQAHPEISGSGATAGPRTGPMYAMIEREAKAAGLALNWPPHLPDTRVALAAAEWVRRNQPVLFSEFQGQLFAAHFVMNEDLGNANMTDRYARATGVEIDALQLALADESAFEAVTESEALGRSFGVRGTPAWLINQRLIEGLLPSDEFERLAAAVAEQSDF